MCTEIRPFFVLMGGPTQSFYHSSDRDDNGEKKEPKLKLFLLVSSILCKRRYYSLDGAALSRTTFTLKRARHNTDLDCYRSQTLYVASSLQGTKKYRPHSYNHHSRRKSPSRKALMTEDGSCRVRPESNVIYCLNSFAASFPPYLVLLSGTGHHVGLVLA
jgi:hypothetical protein